MKLVSHLREDLVAGFLVFLIALPLSLGISMASGFPPFAGVLTAIVGGLVTTFFGSAPLTIKGPAAGLIVIVLSAVDELGKGDPTRAYRLVLAVVVVTGVIQCLLGVAKAGVFGDLFPASVVHGMLAAIGVIIISKQVHVGLGVTPESRDPLALLAEIPNSIQHANPGVAVIGLLSFLLLYIWPWVARTHYGRLLRFIPGPVMVLVCSIPLGLWLGLAQAHHVHWGAMIFNVGPAFLVRVPKHLQEIVAFPDFSMAHTAVFWKHVAFFTLVSSLESLLSAKAIDNLDPLHRKTHLDADMRAQGIGNAVVGLIGGLPMISEIVRSSANVQNGGRTQWANFFHGAFLLLFIAIFPDVVHQIPLAALAAMLVYTGLRLASPKEFANVLHIGREQLVIFTTTLMVTLATDLLVGIAAGIGVKVIWHLCNGVKAKYFLVPKLQRIDHENEVWIRIEEAAVFSNYLGIRKALHSIDRSKTVVVDISQAVFVDHTVMQHLDIERVERERSGGAMRVQGMDALRALSNHRLAARKATAIPTPQCPYPTHNISSQMNQGTRDLC